MAMNTNLETPFKPRIARNRKLLHADSAAGRLTVEDGGRRSSTVPTPPVPRAGSNADRAPPASRSPSEKGRRVDPVAKTPRRLYSSPASIPRPLPLPDSGFSFPKLVSGGGGGGGGVVEPSPAPDVSSSVVSRFMSSSAFSCPCGGGVCKVLTSQTASHPGRLYYGCPLPEDKRCTFFIWVDALETYAREKYYCDLGKHVKLLEDRVMMLAEENERLRKKCMLLESSTIRQERIRTS